MDLTMKTLIVWLLIGVSSFVFAEVIEVSKSTNMTQSTIKLQRDDTNEVVIDANKRLMWQDDMAVKTTKKDYNAAVSYCANLMFAGFSDWRLPLRKELLSIVDMTRYNPSIQKGFKYVQAEYYWSNSLYVSATANVWQVSFAYGHDYWGTKDTMLYVRCVRDLPFVNQK